MRSLMAAVCLLLPCLAAAADSDKGRTLGSPAAPVRLEVYSDFECPACKTFHEEMLPLIVKDYVIPGKVAVISHEFPIHVGERQYSRLAAEYATAAARLNIYDPVADALFREQSKWMNNGRVWEAIAGLLTPEQQKRMQVLVKDPSVVAEVQREAVEATKQGIRSTPTIIVSHRGQRYPIPWPINYNLLASLLNGYLK